MLQVTVLFFAKSRELTGTKETSMSLKTELKAAEIVQAILKEYKRFVSYCHQVACVTICSFLVIHWLLIKDFQSQC